MTQPPLLQAYLFDLDGTVYLGEDIIPGAPEAIARLKTRGAGVMYITNKPLSRPQEYAEKLSRLGIPTQPEEIITSSMVLADYLREHEAGARVLLIGEEVVREDLEQAGMIFTDDPLEAEVVALSWTRSFCYDDLNAALQALLRGARLYATNPDTVCPVDAGEVVPDCGATIAAVHACSGRLPDYIAGKPGPMLPLGALARLGVEPQNAALVGDRLETDITCGNRAGMKTIAVLTGVATEETIGAAEGHMRPDYVLGSVAELM
jgi:phosphoglycolate/pyridoxal phosphate phosphatase family enzyme